MIKFFLKVVILLVVASASFNTHAQVVDESFTAAPWVDKQGYSTFNGCEATKIATGIFNVTKKYASGSVTYTMVNAAISATCRMKGKPNIVCRVNPAGNPSPDSGYVMLNEIPVSEFITSVFQNITTIDLLCSWTGAVPRSAILEKSTDGGNTWVYIDSLNGDSACLQRGTLFTGIVINENNVRLKIKSAPTAPHRTRIHSLKIYGIIGVSTLNAPVVSNQNFSADGNSSKGTIVDTVRASDADPGQTLSYKITKGNTGNLFAINSSTGTITVNGKLDFKKTSSYFLQVKVSDNGTPVKSVYATVLITIKNVEAK